MIRNIFFLITISVFVQMFLPLQVKAETSINIENLTNKTGLPEGAINCIAQDSYGFIWIGTWKGLFRYDGYDVINFSAINRHFNALKIEEIIINNNDCRSYGLKRLSNLEESRSRRARPPEEYC